MYEYDGWTDNNWKGTMKRLFGNKITKATNFFGMLRTEDGTPNTKPVGKIHILYNESDRALQLSASWLQNYEDRIGRIGHKYGGDSKVRPEFRDYIVSFNVGDQLHNNFKDDATAGHSYEFEPLCLSYYESQIDIRQLNPSESSGFYTLKNKNTTGSFCWGISRWDSIHARVGCCNWIVWP